MDSRRVLYLLNLLSRETRNHPQGLSALYQRALDENDEILRFRALREGCAFYSETGKALCRQGEGILERIYASPAEALSLLQELRQAGETMELEEKACRERMESPYPFLGGVAVLRKVRIPGYLEALRETAAACTYLLALYEGLSPLKELDWNDSAGVQEKLYAVNTKFLPALRRGKRPAYCWVVRKRPMGGKISFGGDGFFLSYEAPDRVEALCSTLDKEAMGTHAFLNVRAYEAGEEEVPFCWGMGNLLSVAPTKALSLLQGGGVTRLRSPKDWELQQPLPAPMGCLRALSDGGSFCISPEELVLAMNRWQVGHEIQQRKESRRCLFCGNPVKKGRLVCSSHFPSEL